MNDSNLLQLSAYDYYLPKELIAQQPTANRTESRLLHLRKKSKQISHEQFNDISAYLNEGDVMVINSSKVFPARLFAKKENGTGIEVLLLHQTSPMGWKCMISPGKRVKKAQTLYFSDYLTAYVSEGDSEGLRDIEFTCTVAFWDEIYRIGHVPLPPYIDRKDELSDLSRYQTVYAKEIGSVAAPTAGLHFDDNMLDFLKKKGVEIIDVVLHVGIGTFRPVKVENITHHKMHSELAYISAENAELINTAKREGRRVIAVGTTSARTVESFWNDGILSHGSKWTDIFIYPGYQFKVINAMITNFHLPQSTLLMMISAFAGYEFTMKAYEEAVKNKYRFFSYGDAMFIED